MKVDMKEMEITNKVLAIVQFGPATPHSGFRAGEYYQCTIDPNMVSPSGKFIRFEQPLQGGEVHGWQRIEGLTVCEILGDAKEYEKPDGYTEVEGASVRMMALA